MTPSEFTPTERKLVASFPLGLATALRGDRTASTRRQVELARDLSALKDREVRRAFGTGGGVAGGFNARILSGAAARFDPRKLAGCVLYLDAARDGAKTLDLTVSALVAGTDLSNAAWTKNSVTITPNAAVAPDTTTTATLITSTVTAVTKGAFQSPTNPMVGIYAPLFYYVFYAKYVDTRYALHYGDAASADSARCCFFDIQNGVLGYRGGHYPNSRITSVGSGWYKCESWKYGTLDRLASIYLSSADTTPTDPPTGSSMYFWGGAVEQPRCATIVNLATNTSWSQASGVVMPGWTDYMFAANSRAGFSFHAAQYIASTVGTETALIAAGTDTAGYTLFASMLPRLADVTAYAMGFYHSTTAARMKAWGQSNTLTGRVAHYFTNNAPTSGNITTAGPPAVAQQIHEWYSTAGVTHSLQINGATADPSGGTANPGTFTPNRFGLGARVDDTPDGFWSGGVGQVVLHNRELGSAERSYIRFGLGYANGVAVV